VVGRHERGAALAGQADEHGVDVGPPVLIDQVDLHGDGALQLDHDVETASATRASSRVRRVGDRLQLVQHRRVDQQVPGQEPGRHQIQDPAVDQRAGVHHEDLRARASPLKPRRRGGTT
jgi:hypothetical protein